ncbi:MAG TPA: glutamine synthetase family protein [Solirubrobacteraceae bacterium]
MAALDQIRGTRPEIARAIDAGEIDVVEILWPDHQGHPRGKRIEAEGFLARAAGQGFAFCDAALTWDVAGDVKDGLRLSSWDTGYPDMFAVPDLATYRPLPWRPRTGQVVCDLVDHRGEFVRTAPRTVLRRVLDRLQALGYEARVGIEIEAHLLDAHGTPLSDGLHAYSLQKLGELDPVIDEIVGGLRGFVDLEGANTEYGPGQVEINLRHAPALAAADQATRLKYAVRELARRGGAIATFMAKPFADQAGNSMHVHLSLWRDGEPVFASEDGAENDLHRRAIGGLLAHLPGITLYGAPTVNSYKRFEELSFAPTTVNWSGDNRTVAVRSLVEAPGATRVELRAGAADAQPHWAVAGALAAVVAGLEGDGGDTGPRREGNLYGDGPALPATLAAGVSAAREDLVVTDILGADAVHDYAALAQLEWEAFVGAVSDWDRERYLRAV